MLAAQKRIWSLAVVLAASAGVAAAAPGSKPAVTTASAPAGKAGERLQSRPIGIGDLDPKREVPRLVTPAQAAKGGLYGLYPEMYAKAKDIIAAGGDAKEALAQVDEQLKSVILSPPGDKPARLEQLFCLRGALEGFPACADRDMTAYLLDKPALLGRFLHAMEGRDKLPQAVAVLKKLKDFDAQRFAQYPEFALAFAVVWRDYHPYWWVEKRNGPAKPEQMLEVYKYFADNQARMMLDPWALPFELSMFVVGTPVSAVERGWVLKNYAGRLTAKAIYPSVPWTQKLSPAHGEGNDIEYTLMNIRAIGGVCMEQAYYSEQVLRLKGVPAIYMHGDGTRGGHAWCGELQIGAHPSWDFTAGRYRYDHYYQGAAYDPGDMNKELKEESISMAAALWWTGPSAMPKVEQSYFLYQAAAWALANLPEKIEGDKPMTRVALVLNLATESLDANPYNYPMWAWVAGLAAKKQLDANQGLAWAKKLSDTMLTTFPGFVVACIDDYLGCVSDLDVKIQLYAKMYAYFSKVRPDLASNGKVAEGDLWVQKGDAKAALQCYVYPMVNFSKDDHILSRAKQCLEKIDEKLDPAKVEDACVENLKLLFANPKRTPEQIEASDIILKKLVAIYEKRGDNEKAEKYKKAITKKE